MKSREEIELKNQIHFFEDKQRALNDELNRISITIKLLKAHQLHISEKMAPIKNRSDKIDWKNIAVSILKEKNQLLSTNEIYDIAKIKFAEIQLIKTDGYNIKLLSNALITLTEKKDRCKKFKIKGEKGNLWGLSDFFTTISSFPTPVPKLEYNNDLLIRGFKTNLNKESYLNNQINKDPDDLERYSR